MHLNLDEARDLKTHFEVELAATRIALKKAKKKLFSRRCVERLDCQAKAYERQVEYHDQLIANLEATSILKKPQA